ncbi:MAG: hypothetical protein COV70_02270 [Parcubacteria group bacterium CG11_big_fil_rev_8_21_14_0_20_39_22]|nr:MAG: hypothetical protein COV70_02270 [Parcubacteria group bacterium CG11_big_fil_rev_8_21_14_0_20_39_22]
MSKKILITSFHPIISRNILQTEIIKMLIEDSCISSIVLLVPAGKEDFFNKNFGSEKVSVTSVRLNLPSRKLVGLLFKRVARYLLPTETNLVQSDYKFYRDHRFCSHQVRRFLRFLGGFKIIRSIFRTMDFYFSPMGDFPLILSRESPDLVFSTDVQNENDVALIKTAKKSGITVYSMLRSWDNLTVHGLVRIAPDKLLVGSEVLKEYAIKIHDLSENIISVVGIPHYDKYRKPPAITKDEFFKQNGLDKSNPTIMYAPVGDRYILSNDIDSSVIKILLDIDCNLIVRFPPMDSVELAIDKIRTKNTYFDYPGQSFEDQGVGGREIREEDDNRLFWEIFYSDIVICGPSSIALDAVLHDKPVIMVDFYDPPRPEMERIICYKYDHLVDIINTKGVYLAKTRDKFESQIATYLNDHSIDKEFREKIRNRQLKYIDGGSSERIAKLILEYLCLEKK